MSDPEPQPHAETALDLADTYAKGSEADTAPLADANRDSSSSEFPVSSWERYEFLKLLGRGGMGAVYMARDRKLGRIVALKFILSSDPATVQRFQQEARAQARIDHPYICKVFEVGEVAGKAYIAMQYLAGQSLDEAGPRLTLPEKVELIRAAAEALHEAHRQGIIHRDIKPANIMVERSEDGRVRPVVMDFGIAREASGDSNLTETGALMGTPAYMSPEQARGGAHELDRRTDVYSLGATLYELLTGKAPFSGQALVDILFKVIEREPLAPRRLVRSLPVDLETIVLKCLSKEPDQRYDSARALADDLQRYIDGEPIVARKHSVRYLIQKQVRKHKALVAISCASLVWIAMLSVDSIRGRLAASRQAKLTEQQVTRARQLGQDSKEIEWFMRAIYELPQHDTSHEQELIRGRMQKIEGQLGELGREGGSLVHYALGRGYLALHEYPQAEQHLQESLASGNGKSAGLHYSLGRVLGRRYYDAIRLARQSGDARWFEERRKSIEHELLEPAMFHLEKSRGLVLESASYLEGLIAFYKNQDEEALLHADKALWQAPWLYEAKLLKADVFYEQAQRARRRGDHAQVERSLGMAMSLYAEAAQVGRSDVSIQEAQADAWLLKMMEEKDRGRSPEELLGSALMAARAAIEISPSRTRGYQQMAAMHLYVADELLNRGGDPRPQVQLLVSAARQGIAHGVADAHLYNALANGSLLVLFYEDAHGLPQSIPIEELFRHQQRAIELNPLFPWAFNDLAGVYMFRANLQLGKGEDPREDLGAAIRYTEQALKLYRDYANGYSNLAFFRNLLAGHLVEQGRDPASELQLGAASVAECLRREPEKAECYSNQALLELTAARYLAAEPRRQAELGPQLEKTLAALASAGQRGGKTLEWYQSVAAARLLALRQSRSAVSMLAAQAAVEECRHEHPEDATCAIAAAELALEEPVEAESAKRRERRLDQALAAAKEAVASNPRSADGYRTAAAVRLARAAGLFGRKQQAQLAAELAAGREAIEKSLQLNPRAARALAVRAQLQQLESSGAGAIKSGLDDSRHGNISEKIFGADEKTLRTGGEK